MKLPNTLGEYLKLYAKDNTIDFTLRVICLNDDTFRGYVYPSGKNGMTLDFKIDQNNNILMTNVTGEKNG